MADRKLSIRFSAEGLDEVKAKLRSLGEEGAKALKQIEDGAAKAGQRELDQLGKKLAATERSLDPLARSAQKVAEAIALQNRAITAGAADLDRYAAVVQKAQAAHAAAQVAYARTGAVVAQTSGAMKLQQFQVLQLGQQFQDFGIQVAGGQNALVAFAQQASQASFILGGFGNALSLIGAGFAAVGAAARANPITAALTAAAAAAAALGTAYALLREKSDEAKVSNENYALAVQAAAEADATATASAERLAAARRSEANFFVKNAQNEQEINLKLLESRRKMTEDYIAAAKALPEGSAARAIALAPLQRALAIVEKQIADTTMRMSQLEIASGKVNRKGVEIGEADAHMRDYARAVEEARKIVEGTRTATQVYADEIAKLNQGQRLGEVGTEAYARRVENLNNWLWENSDAAKAAAEQGKYYLDQLKKTEKAMTDAYEADVKMAEQIARRNVPASEAYAEQIANIERLQKRNLLTTEEASRATENLNQWLQEQDPAFQAAKKAADDYARALERIVDRTADRLVDFGADAFFDAMTGKSTDFWKTFEEQGKRALAQMAAEALIRPIILPIVQSVVGGAPGLFGLAGQAGQAAGGGFGGIGNLFSGIRSMFSGDNFIASAFPSLFGSGTSAAALGIGAEFGLATTVGAGAGGIGAAAPLAGLAPFLPMLAFALPMLFSMFGGKKSVGPNGNAIINWERDAEGRLTNPGGLAIGGLGADNGGDKEYARKMAEAATKGFNTIVDRIGGRATGVPGANLSNQLELGYFAEGNKFFSVVGGEKEEFGSSEEAVANFIKRALQKGTIEGISEDVRIAIQKTTAKSAEELGGDIEFALGFRRRVDLAAAGPGTRAAQLLGFQYAAQDQAQQQRIAARDFVGNARRLYGDDSSQLADAQATVLKQALNAIGLGPDATGDNAPLEGRAAAIAAANEQIKAYRETLIDAGLTAAQADTKIAEATTKANEKINKAFDWLDDLEDFQEAAGALSVDIARWSYEANQAVQAEQDAISAKQDYVDALQREIAVQEEAADAYGRLAESLKKGRLGLLIDANLSPLSPADRLAEANRQFNDIYGRAQGGDLKAGEQLYDIGRALLEAERAYSASSPAYVQTFNKVQTALQNTETLAERQAKIANEQLVTLRGQLSELQTQGGHIKTVAEAAQAYKDAQGAANTANANRPTPAQIGEQQFQTFGTLATRFQGLYAGATTDAQRAQVYSTAASQRDALINAITDIPTLQRILDVFYRSQPDEVGANVIRTRLYGLGAVPAFAEGGIVDRPTLGWIAEAGRSEAVVPLSRGRSIPVEMRSPANDGGGSGLVTEIRALRQAMADVSTLLARNGSAQQGTLDALRADFARLSNKLVELEARQNPRRTGTGG